MTPSLDDDDLIQILPDDIQAGSDDDGLPRAEPVAKPKADKKPEVRAKPETSEVNPEVEELRRRAESERQAREKAEEDGRKAVETERAEREKLADALNKSNDRVVNEYWNRLTAEHQQISSAIETTKERLTHAEQDLARAREAGDVARETQLTRFIARAEVDLATLEQGKSGAEEQLNRTREAIKARAAQPKDPEPQPPKTEKKEAAAEPEPPKKPATPEDWIAQFPRKTATWLRDHKDFVTDPAKHRELIDWCNEWAADYGQHTLHGPQFIEALQQRFSPKVEDDIEEDDPDMSDAEIDDTPEPAKPKAEPRKSAPAAPVSRSATPSQSSNSNGAIKLTKEQYAIAPDLYPTYEDLSPDIKRKFPAWSAAAARFQYHADLRRAEKDGKYIR